MMMMLRKRTNQVRNQFKGLVLPKVKFSLMLQMLMLLAFSTRRTGTDSLCFLLDNNKEAMKKGLSDMDYLRSKIVAKSDMIDEVEMEKADEDDSGEADEDDDDDDEDEEEKDEDEDEESPVQNTDSAYESGDKTSSQNSAKPAVPYNKVHFLKNGVTRFDMGLF